MKQFGAVAVLLVVVYLTTALSVQAAIPTLYTNDNFFTSEHDAPVSFNRDVLGNFYGVTESGKDFYQRAVVTSIAVHLQCFSIDEAYFYISGEGIILAQNDTVALSIYLSRLV